MPEIVAFTRPLTHAGKHREAAVLGRHVVDQLLNDNGLANAGAAEQADLATLQKRLDQVDDLDARLKHLFRRRLLVERRCLTVNRHVNLCVHRAEFVHGLAEHVQHATQRLTAHRDRDACAGVDRLHAANHAFGRDHGDATHAAFAKMLLHFHHHVHRVRRHKAVTDNAQRLEDGRHVRLAELNVNGRAADAYDFSDVLCHSFFSYSKTCC